ncbi:hypothetical protein DSO57_1026238 [Entomophthora muscae]|uniref:Uncharacterized protein n=1 Tax=Entomophthora muscae TaxID=34485 RepID=A0ACC2UCI0_9FUNG|nr:hypothetical protein DSO57_1026238 [Entomophthora muscae]
MPPKSTPINPKKATPSRSKKPGPKTSKKATKKTPEPSPSPEEECGVPVHQSPKCVLDQSQGPAGRDCHSLVRENVSQKYV